MAAHVGEANRPPLAEDRPEETMQPGERADPIGLAPADADVDERLEPVSALDAERAVARADQARGRDEDPPQRAVEVELAADREGGVVQRLEARGRPVRS